MPQTTVIFYQDDEGQVPVLAWLRALHQRERRAYAKCIARIQRSLGTVFSESADAETSEPGRNRAGAELR